MLLKEFQIILPMTVEEYQVAQLYCVAEASKQETGGGDGVEVLKNEPFSPTNNAPNPPLLEGDPKFTTGQYTHKYYHLSQKVPGFVRAIVPRSALKLEEVAWNAYPYCRTVLTNGYFTEGFSITIESLHSSDITLDNAHQLSPEELSTRELVVIDIANIKPSDRDYREEEDPTRIRSNKTGRGPLIPNWWEQHHDGPIMCAYKLVRCQCKIRFLQTRLEKLIMQQEFRLFNNFHRQVYCTMDDWFGMTMEDIRHIEEETKKKLEEQRIVGPLRGHTGEE